jgi:hypothetical protein
MAGCSQVEPRSHDLPWLARFLVSGAPVPSSGLPAAHGLEVMKPQSLLAPLHEIEVKSKDTISIHATQIHFKVARAASIFTLYSHCILAVRFAYKLTPNWGELRLRLWFRRFGMGSDDGI